MGCAGSGSFARMVPVMRIILPALLTSAVLLAQNPFEVAGDHYRLAFENPWVRATRVTYGPHETAPVHNHPPNPVTVYVYVTGFTIDRKPVKAGAIRVAQDRKSVV